MVALALDIGGTRTGIAVADRTGRVAMPLKVLPASEVEGMARTFRMILEDHEPDVLVCGLPQTMSGEAGPEGMARTFRMILEDHEPDVLVCGLPQTMSGEAGPQAEHIREVAGRIAAATGLPRRCDRPSARIHRRAPHVHRGKAHPARTGFERETDAR